MMQFLLADGYLVQRAQQIGICLVFAPRYLLCAA